MLFIYYVCCFLKFFIVFIIKAKLSCRVLEAVSPNYYLYIYKYVNNILLIYI